MHNPKYLVGVGPLIVVDRDGSIAMAVGGILSQKTQRTIKVLYNGLEGYWTETQGRTGSGFTPPAMPAAPETPATPTPGTSPPPAKPAKKSAGC
jgi:hydroxyacylglutathione hydrolase